MRLLEHDTTPAANLPATGAFSVNVGFAAVDLHLIAVLVLAFAYVFIRLRSQSREHKALRKAEHALADATDQAAVLQAVAQHANDGLVFQDMDARILWANPSYCRIMGRDLSEILGRRPQEFCFPPEAKPDDAMIENFRFEPNDIVFDRLHRHPNMRKNGERFWHEFNMSMIETSQGEERVILVSRDVTEQVLREHELERARSDLLYSAHHDALTGLSNRTAFVTTADEILSGTDCTRGELGLLYIDLNHFKSVNDTHGHAAGDAILTHVADTIRSVAREGDLACRMGGDEFVMACVGIDDFDALQYVADHLLERIRVPIPWHDTSLTCGASIGLAVSDPANRQAEDLIRSADFALYEAKAHGAPNIARFDAELHVRQETEKRLMREFSETLDKGGISFVFQPVMDAAEGRIVSFETLARWRRADGRVVAPDRFLPFAARLNRMADIDFAAIRATAALTAELAGRGHRIRGAFNTSSESLAHPDFLKTLEKEVARAGLPAEDLTAEVLETTFFGSDTTDSIAAERITQLRQAGYHVYLDDFGVGYAGLVHLGQLDITGIKLDRSLVANVVHDKSARIIAISILNMCDELGVASLAEGIETEEQAAFLTLHGCRHLQGFGIAHPMDRAALIDMIDRGAPLKIPTERALSQSRLRA